MITTENRLRRSIRPTNLNSFSSLHRCNDDLFSVMKTTNNLVLGSTILFCIILVVVQHQSANGQKWNNGGSGSKWQLNCDFSGQEIERIEATGDKCSDLCIASINCTHFHHASDGYCHLKNAPLETESTFSSDGACGFVPWKFEPGRDHWIGVRSGVQWLKDCDFVGHDIGQEPSSPDHCGGMCLSNPECTHFRHDEVFCKLKKAPLTTLRTAVNGGICGYIPSRDLNNMNNNTKDSQDFCECECV